MDQKSITRLGPSFHVEVCIGGGEDFWNACGILYRHTLGYRQCLSLGDGHKLR